MRRVRLEDEPVARPRVSGDIRHRIRKPARRPHDGHGAVSEADDLAQAARFEARWHQEEVCTRVDLVRQHLVVLQHRHERMFFLRERSHRLLILPLARPEEDELRPEAEDGTDRQRQNQVPSPSRYLFSENDRPLYLPVSDFFERGSSLKIQISMLHDLGYAEINATSFPPNGVGPFADSNIPGNAIPGPSETVANGAGRVVVGIGGTLTFTMLGYKILQAQSPAV